MNITNETINTLLAGGAELTKKMDNLLGFSDIIQSLNIKKKGLALEKIALSLISARIDQPDSVWNSVEHLKNMSSAPQVFNINSKEIKQKTFYRGLVLLGNNFEKIYPLLMEPVNKHFKLDMNNVFIDWTSSYFNGNKCSLAKHGFSKDHRPDKRQVKIGLAMTAGKCIPFHISLEEGNLVDMKHFKKDYLAFKKKLPKNTLIIFDKGAKSKGNCKMICDNGNDYLSAIRDAAELREKIKQVDKDSMMELVSYENGDKVFGYWKLCGEVYEYLYYDERKAKKDVKKRQKMMNKVLKKNKELLKKIQKKGFKAVTKKKRKTAELNNLIVTTNITIQERLVEKTDEEILAELEEDKYLDGFFALESSRNLKPKNALRLYRRKDKIEKLFSDLKSVHKIRPFRVWDDDAVKGAALICMVATLFVGLLQLTMKCVRKTKKTILDRLRRLTLVVNFDGFGNIIRKRFANVGEFLLKFINLSFG